MMKPTDPQALEEARGILRTLLEAEPMLNANGMGYLESYCGKTLEERRAWHQREREALLSDHNVDAFIRCCAWLDAAVRTKHPTPYANSYWIKHIVERAMGGYVPNGALVAAGLYKKIPHRPAQRSPNVEFAIPKRWLVDQERVADRASHARLLEGARLLQEQRA